MKDTFFPKEFLDKYKIYCGNEWNAFFETIKIKQPKSFWVNTNKTTSKEIEQILKEKNIVFKKYSFSDQAYFIDYKKPGDLGIFKDGKISMQEKAAMLPAIILGVKKGETVLDACASPGMKTIQLSNFVGNGKIIACDVNSTRFKSLLHNKFSYDLKNTNALRIDVRNIKEKFDRILLDAPCSSEGLVRKRKEALHGWSNILVRKKSKAQKDLILSCFDMLKPKGTMVYATCSFAQEENEDIINFLLDKREAKYCQLN